MSSESLQGALAPSRENVRTPVRTNFGRENLSKFGIVVRALWPIKPALNLAQRAGLTERMAQYLIDGKRKPNARVAFVVLGEIIDFH
jgi:hypothetical protein